MSLCQTPIIIEIEKCRKQSPWIIPLTGNLDWMFYNHSIDGIDNNDVGLFESFNVKHDLILQLLSWQSTVS